MHISTLLLDDERSFTDGRDAVVARTVDDAIDIFFEGDENETVRSNVRVDEMWLDFVLPFGSGSDFAFAAARAAHRGTPLNVGVFYTHTDSFAGAALMEDTLTKAGYTVERIDLEPRETIPLTK